MADEGVRKFSQLSDHDKGWVVGILEGEGCFDKKDKRHRVRVSMSDKDVVEKIHRLIPTTYALRSNLSKRYNAHGKRHETMYHFEISGSNATLLMIDVFPYMSERRRLKIQQMLLDE